MPAPQFQVGKVNTPATVLRTYGGWGIVEGEAGPYGDGNGSYLYGGVTGGPNAALSGGVSVPLVADITYKPGTTVLMPARGAGNNPSSGAGSKTSSYLRPYCVGWSIQMFGATAWTGASHIEIQDTNNNTLIYIPVTALSWPAVNFSGPDTEFPAPILITATGAANSNGTVPFGSNSLITTYANNCPFNIIAGTGQGSAGVIASSTATSLTPANGANAFPNGVDSTSVFAVYYWGVASATSTALTLATQNGSTNAMLTANQLLNAQCSVIAINGTSAGQSRILTANSATVATVGTAFTTTAVAGDLMYFTNNPTQQGIVDMWAGDMVPAAGRGTGFQVYVPTGMSAGSTIRIQLWGYYAR